MTFTKSSYFPCGPDIQILRQSSRTRHDWIKGNIWCPGGTTHVIEDIDLGGFKIKCIETAKGNEMHISGPFFRWDIQYSKTSITYSKTLHWHFASNNRLLSIYMYVISSISNCIEPCSWAVSKSLKSFESSLSLFV